MGVKDKVKLLMPKWLWDGLKNCEDRYYEKMQTCGEIQAVGM